MNFLPCTCSAISDTAVTVTLACGTEAIVPVPAERVAIGDTLALGIRPNDLSPGVTGVAIAYTPEVVERLGSETVIYGQDAQANSICAVADGAVRMPVGEAQNLHFDPRDAHLFRADGSAFERDVDLAALAELD